jgi:hypothetical protein
MFKKATSLLLLGIASNQTLADLTDPTLMNTVYSSEIEKQAAIANQQVYDDLSAQGCNDTDASATANCSGATFFVWQNVRELVHTANDELGVGPTEYSLGGDTSETLPLALRWTAAEEFSTQGDLTESFVTNALTGLSNRVTALRSGVRGFNLAVNGYNNETLTNDLYGGAAGDGNSEAWSPWGAFLNASHTWGNKGNSSREAAYDFDGASLNGGFDYRINSNWVAGVTLSYTNERLDFDSSKTPAVDGEVEMDAYSIIPFAFWQTDEWFILGSLGYQQAQFENTRDIKYPTANNNSEATNTTAISKNDSNSITATLGAGFFWVPPEYPMFAFEPSIGINYRKTSIEEYTEKDIKNDGFNFEVEEQNIDSIEGVLGVKAQYTFTPGFAVLVPFIEAQRFVEHIDDEHTINATYANIADQGLNPNATFQLKTNNPEDDYMMYTVGLTAVLRGSRQVAADGSASGGLQAFASASAIKGIANYEQYILNGGLRYEF